MRSLHENHGMKGMKFGIGMEGRCKLYTEIAREHARTHTHTCSLQNIIYA
jgi:hypothetical protein